MPIGKKTPVQCTLGDRTEVVGEWLAGCTLVLFTKAHLSYIVCIVSFLYPINSHCKVLSQGVQGKVGTTVLPITRIHYIVVLSRRETKGSFRNVCYST